MTIVIMIVLNHLFAIFLENYGISAYTILLVESEKTFSTIMLLVTRLNFKHIILQNKAITLKGL